MDAYPRDCGTARAATTTPATIGTQTCALIQREPGQDREAAMHPSANPLPDRCGHWTWPWPSRWARKWFISASLSVWVGDLCRDVVCGDRVRHEVRESHPPRTNNAQATLTRAPCRGAESGEQQVNDMGLWCRELIRDRFGIEDLFCLVVAQLSGDVGQPEVEGFVGLVDNCRGELQVPRRRLTDRKSAAARSVRPSHELRRGCATESNRGLPQRNASERS